MLERAYEEIKEILSKFKDDSKASDMELIILQIELLRGFI